jgi:hypothetical protein
MLKHYSEKRQATAMKVPKPDFRCKMREAGNKCFTNTYCDDASPTAYLINAQHDGKIGISLFRMPIYPCMYVSTALCWTLAAVSVS